MVVDDLIFDIGVNHGEDTAFYLAKGFRVVGVEANPIIHASLRETFGEEIATGQLTLLNVGLAAELGSATFYVNDDNDHWSSFVEAYGTRNGSKYHTVPIDCLTIFALLGRYGTPRYLKIDIEGMDQTVVRQLRAVAEHPTFISVEEYGVEAIDDLQALGFDRFKLAAQRDKSWATPPNPPLEGAYVEKRFDGKDTGLFGNELPGNWADYCAIRNQFISSIRQENHTYIGPENEWFDIHATRGSRC